DLRLALRTALRPSGDLGRILAYLHEAESLAAALDDPGRLGQVSRFLSFHFSQRGAYDQAIAAAQRALALATAHEDIVLHALANDFLGRVYQAQGTPPARPGRESLARDDPPSPFPLGGCGLGRGVHAGWARRRCRATAYAGNRTGHCNGNGSRAGGLLSPSGGSTYAGRSPGGG